MPEVSPAKADQFAHWMRSARDDRFVAMMLGIRSSDRAPRPHGGIARVHERGDQPGRGSAGTIGAGRW